VSRKESWETIFWLRLGIATEILSKEEVAEIEKWDAQPVLSPAQSSPQPELPTAQDRGSLR